GFHKRNSDNLIEGLVTETGLGFIIRKKFSRLVDIFRKQMPSIPPNGKAQEQNTLIAPAPKDSENPVSHDEEK
ncbi:MAG: hypothetical protein ACFNP9_05000, partial [Porphyromonas endodontalis]